MHQPVFEIKKGVLKVKLGKKKSGKEMYTNKLIKNGRNLNEEPI